MLKKLLITTALSGLMLSSALAQYSSPSSPSSSPSATPPAASSGDTMKSDTPKADASKSSDASKSTTGASASAIAAQKPDQLLASKVKGADVIGSDDKKIGDISDLLFSKDGKLEAYILSVGGFLGVGAKEVALAPSNVQVVQDNNTWKLKVSMTKDQLAQAPNFEHYKDQRTTTGASGTSGTGASSSGTGATAPRNAPSGGAMAPSSGSSSNPPANRP